jgi:hypothetical protein
VILHGSVKGTWESRWRFSPALAYAVKFDFRTIHGDPPPNPPRSWELVSVRAP